MPQPTDSKLNPIPVLKPVNGSDYELDVTGTAARTPKIPEKVVSVYAEKACFIKLGASDVTASSSDYNVFLPDGSYREYHLSGGDYISAIQSSESGKLYISGLE